MTFNISSTARTLFDEVVLFYGFYGLRRRVYEVYTYPLVDTTVCLQTVLLIRESNVVGELGKPENEREQTQMQALTVSPIEAACYHQLLHPLRPGPWSLPPSSDYRMLVAFYGRHRPGHERRSPEIPFGVAFGPVPRFPECVPV